MILQALNSYYERMAAEPDTEMPPLGTSIESISFALIVDEEGKLQDVEDLRIVEGKKFSPRKMLVPAGEKKANGAG
jgi:CRISPR-associated protein Csd1